LDSHSGSAAWLRLSAQVLGPHVLVGSQADFHRFSGRHAAWFRFGREAA
jgi:hypothetical protein